LRPWNWARPTATASDQRCFERPNRRRPSCSDHTRGLAPVTAPTQQRPSPDHCLSAALCSRGSPAHVRHHADSDAALICSASFSSSRRHPSRVPAASLLCSPSLCRALTYHRRSAVAERHRRCLCTMSHRCSCAFCAWGSPPGRARFKPPAVEETQSH
jgi:hypothetical protein